MGCSAARVDDPRGSAAILGPPNEPYYEGLLFLLKIPFDWAISGGQ